LTTLVGGVLLASCTSSPYNPCVAQPGPALLAVYTVLENQEGCSVSVSGACTLDDGCQCPTSRGCSRWLGTVTGAEGTTCSVTVRCGAKVRVTAVPGFNACDGVSVPAPKVLRIGADLAVAERFAVSKGAKDCSYALPVSSTDPDLIGVRMWDPPPT
jgi:hypothetical protein